jgi:hypothetical protein
MSTQLKRKIAFSLSMGVVTTGIISFVVLALNLGFSNDCPRMGALLGHRVHDCHSRHPAARPATARANRPSR